MSWEVTVQSRDFSYGTKTIVPYDQDECPRHVIDDGIITVSGERDQPLVLVNAGDMAVTIINKKTGDADPLT